MPQRGGLHGTLHVPCLSQGCDAEHAESVSVAALLFHARVSVWSTVYTCLMMMSWTKEACSDLRVSRRWRRVLFSSHPVSLSPRVSLLSKGQGFYPLMNSDCQSKVWIIEFLINYPELLLDKSAPLQPPSSSVVFYLIWPASCSPEPALHCPCLINADLVTETDAAVCFDASSGSSMKTNYPSEKHRSLPRLHNHPNLLLWWW